jgi:hypothetical protein
MRGHNVRRLHIIQQRLESNSYILSRLEVTTDGVRTGEWIYWSLHTRLRTTSNYSTTANLTIHKSPKHLLNLFRPAVSSPPVPWQRLLTVEILNFMTSGPIFPASRAALNWNINRVSVWVLCQSASLSWNKAPIRGLRPDFYYCQTVAGLLIWGALSDDRTGLLFKIVAGPRQHNHSRVRVPWDSWSYFTVFGTSICVVSYDSQD